MSKRLEEIKEKVVVEKVYVKQLNTRNNGYWTKSHLVLKDDWNWLIEQAERVQELEEELQELRKRYLTLTKENNQINDELIDVFRENKRYREAIDKIKGELYKMSAWGKEEISMLDIIYDLEGEG